MVWMWRPVDRSITVSAPQRIDHTILSTSSATPLVTALLPILALTLVRKLRPMIIGSVSGWLILAEIYVPPPGAVRCSKLHVVIHGIVYHYPVPLAGRLTRRV